MTNWREGVVFGLVGASISLLVWFGSSWILDGMPVTQGMQKSVYWAGVLLGLAPVGTLLGATLPLLESIRRESFGGALKHRGHVAALGAGLAGIGALLGGAGGDWLFLYFRGTDSPGLAQILAARLVGGVVLGFMIGLAIGVTERIRLGSNERLTSAIVGAGIGGAIACVSFEGLGEMAQSSNVLAFSYTALGGLLAGAIGLVTRIRTQAFLTGMAENQRKYKVWEFALPGDSVTLIGSAGRPSPRATLKLYSDDTIEREHAAVSRRGEKWYVERPNGSRGELFVNELDVLNTPLPLRHGDVIRIGQLKFRFVHRAEATARHGRDQKQLVVTLLIGGLLAGGTFGGTAAAQPSAEPMLLKPRETTLTGDGRVILWMWRPDKAGNPAEFTLPPKEKLRVTRGKGGPALVVEEVRTAGRGGAAPLYYLIVVDTSGSMKYEGKAAHVKDAVSALLTWISTKSGGEVYVRIRAFDDKVPAETSSGEQLDTGKFLPPRDGALAAMNLRIATYVATEREHNTHLHLAASKAPGVFKEPDVKPGSQRRIVLLTDGKSDVGGGKPETLPVQTVIEEAKRAGIPFYTIGYRVKGADDTGFLQKLGEETGGGWKPDASDRDIASMFQDVVTSAHKEVGLVVALQGTVAPTEVFFVDGSRVVIPLSWLLGPYPRGASSGAETERWLFFGVLALGLVTGSVLISMIRPSVEIGDMEPPAPPRPPDAGENPFAYKPEVRVRRTTGPSRPS